MESHGKHEAPNITLRVKESRVSTTGTVRINTATLEKLQMTEGEKLDIYFVEKKRTVIAYADDIIDEGEISIRNEDMDDLGAANGENVVVSPHEPFTERLKETLEESTGRLKETVGESTEKIKHKLEEFKHDDKETESGKGACEEECLKKESFLDKLKGVFKKKQG